MKPPVRREGNLLGFVEKLADFYCLHHKAGVRKLKGQFFTPKEVGSFMANLFEIKRDKIELLDPGAGVGMLSCAFCVRLLNFKKPISINIDAYENDPELIRLLESSLEACKEELEKIGHKLSYKVFEQDFILHNAAYFRKGSLFKYTDLKSYDFVISNPPYYKLNKNSPQSTVMMDLISGQPNIYALFMALSTNMLNSDGEMVFITPRSFCSGLYYKKFREWFLDKMLIKNIHIFESRKDVFSKDNVLQENVIIRAKRVEEKTRKFEKITVSKSKDKSFEIIEKIDFSYEDVIHFKDGDVIIRIPTSTIDKEILDVVDKWPNTLHSLGLEISTGPVVPFRAKEYLLREYRNSEKEAPLLWMHNIQNMDVIWPKKKNNKEIAVKICKESKPILLPAKNYVLVKRFSSKEQKRRLYAGILIASKTPGDVIGLENHLNYIHRPAGELTTDEAYGIAALLNSSLADNFFRSLNGNTQVNATDIRKLPLPTINKVIEIGKQVQRKTPKIGFELDSIIKKSLNINIKAVSGGHYDKD